jgi:rod shape-determining protein MreD
MQRRRFLLLLLLLALPAASLLPKWVASEYRPDFFALLLLLAVFRARTEKALPLAWGVGLVKDLFSAGPLGEYALLYLLAGFVLLRLRRILTTRLAVVRAALAFGTVLATESACLCIQVFIQSRHGPVAGASGLFPLASEFRTLLFAAATTAVLSPLLLYWMEQGVKRPRPDASAGTL